MDYRRGRRQSKTWIRWVILALVISAIGYYFKDCQKESVDFKPLAIDRDGYRADELALLQITTENILNLEKHKSYGEIYDQYTSKGFKKSIPRRQFLIMGNCAEQTLGSLLYYNHNENGFKRTQKQQKTYDTISKTVSRIGGDLHEKMTFVRQGFDFRLDSFYWLTPKTELALCIQEAEAPKEVQIKSQTSETPSTTKPTKQKAATKASD